MRRWVGLVALLFMTSCTYNAEMAPDRDTRFEVARFVDERRVDYHVPVSASALTMLTYLSVYALSPITVPLTTQAIGSRAEDLIAQTLDASAKGIRASIADDIEIGQYVASLGGGRSTAAAPPSSAPAATMASSPLDAFLDNVFVIETAAGLGSAFCVSSQLLLTNEHVVHGSALLRVRRRDGQIHRARVVNDVRGKDLALVQLEDTRCTPLPFARLDEIVIGREVWAIGTPEGLSWSVSKGIVSAVREVDATRLVQTDAAVNKGNSGGPLMTAKQAR